MGRRKGSKNRKRLWRVGDPVLAKLTGYPSWPAKVEAPEKYGLPADCEKVFVFFFGTQQIAFINPVDVEAYSEEKKDYLIVNRHTRGSNFHRAVLEIIAYSKKSRNEDKGTNCPLMGEVNMTNGSNSIDSLADSSVKDEGSKAISIDSKKVRYDDDFLVSGASAVDKQDTFRIKEVTPSEDPLCNVNAKEMFLPTGEDNRVEEEQKLFTEKRFMSNRRPRNSSQVNSYKLRNSIQPSSKIIEGGGIGGRYGMRSPSCRRRQTMKSPDVSELKDVGSPDSVFCSTYEKNDSVIGTVGSSSLSFNEGSTMVSGYGLPQTESVVKCTEGDTELSNKLDLPSSAVIVKKKRKPIKKQANSGTNELTGLEKEPASEIEEHKACQTPPSSNKGWDVDYINDDGDEHFPLLKRARARMGLLSSEVEESDSPVHREKSSEVSVMVQGQGPITKVYARRRPKGTEGNSPAEYL
ncbi:protein HUA2-LIKE 3 [Daucus carota subsp. sativus]|uniref:protein HUA2-LIKE 3 n=1 Tax=Daucus carota subsp. sativus TaxID=79200 RepID=UPI0007EFC5A4|nr:PREDICTED: protein HUA2-LIKE 3-like [Daucus carota subsp. sativus]XP_017240650.1 PREDICTED: protein HUA2-LIKE 3-like [Daucus carota subsp. sativus]